MNVKNLTVTVNSAALNNCGAVNGVAFTSASGSIKGVTLTHISRNVRTAATTGVRSSSTISRGPTRQSVKIEGNTVSDYNKNGIDVRGSVDAKIIGNTVTGKASDACRPERHRRSHQCVQRRGATADTDTATAQVWDNKVSGNVYTPDDWEACGILVMGNATVNMTKKNTLTDNEVPFLNEGGSIVGKKISA